MSEPWSTWTAVPEGHALIALGSNLGDRRGQLEDAVERLELHPKVRLLAASSLHRTAPVGGPVGQGEFLNGVVLVHTSLAPEQLLELLHDIEADHGRERVVPNGPRTLDLDLLLHGDLRREPPGLELPHPRLWERTFVLGPLAELCPNLRQAPGDVTVTERLLELASIGAPS
ncbi:MAG: 2-amino-4-hydroxy-6-hydroxymethyldihydropteridine diphosphokinase [Planctomycetota bacterium]|nr:2-amino-4-hydroxy-6-hydroxymethyldihydropteridine diphosphokinase [Planctomycetota bacterium]